MIATTKAYNASLAKLRRIEAELAEHPAMPARPSEIPTALELVRRGQERQVQQLREEIARYEDLRRGRETTVPVRAFSDLARVLILGRVAAGLTQRELAQELGLDEDQIQRYERTEYGSASFARIREVADVLGARFDQPVTVSFRRPRDRNEQPEPAGDRVDAGPRVEVGP